MKQKTTNNKQQKTTIYKNQMSGYVYCAINNNKKNNKYYKVGYTKNVQQRLTQANGADTWDEEHSRKDFSYVYTLRVYNARNVEWAVHILLEKYRHNSGSEFFCASKRKIIQTICFVTGNEQSFVDLAIAKIFNGKTYTGYITSYKEPYWQVVYDDGDREEYDWKELIHGIKESSKYGGV